MPQGQPFRLGGRPVAGMVLLAVLSCGTARAQVADDVVPYLFTLPASARSAGVNGGAAVLLGDPTAIFANPVGIATLAHVAVEGSYRSAPGAASVVTGALGWRLGQFDLGFGMRRFDFGTDPARYLGAGVVAGSDAREILGVASLVYRYGMIAVGASGRYLRRSVDTVHARGLTADVGAAVAFFDIMALTFSVQSIGNNWRETSGLQMPGLTRLGFAMNYVDPQETFRLLSILEAQWPEGGDGRLVLGAEGGIVVEGVGLLARGGYGGASTALAEAGWGFGGSVQFATLTFDYGYRAADLQGERAHYLGARLEF